MNMSDFAKLGFRADTSELPGAVKQLKTLSGAAKEASKASKELEKSSGSLAGTSKSASSALDRVGVSYKNLSDKGKKSVDAINASSGALDNIGGASNKASVAIEKAGSSLGKLLGVLKILASAMVVKQYVAYADTWSDLSARVGLAIKDMDGASVVMGRLQEMARRTYSPLQNTAESFIANSTALRELGLNTAQQLDYTEALNNAFVVSGAKGDRAASVSNALSKAMAGGALRGDELNTVIQTGGRVAELLAERMGSTVSGLRAMGAEGAITSSIIYSTLIDAMETLREEADSMPATVGDAFVLLGNSMLALVGTFDQITGLSGMAASAIIFVADTVDALTHSLDSVIPLAMLVGSSIWDLAMYAGSAILSLTGIGDAISWVGNLFSGVAESAASLSSSFAIFATISEPIRAFTETAFAGANAAEILAAAIISTATVAVGRLAVAFVGTAVPAIGAFAVAMGTQVVGSLSAAAAAFVGTASASGVFSAAVGVASTALRGLAVAAASTGIPLVIMGLTAAILYFQKLVAATGSVSDALDMVSEIGRTALRVVSNEASALKNAVQGLATDMAARFVTSFADIVHAGETAFNGIIAAGASAAAAVVAAWDAFPDAMKRVAALAKNYLIDGMQGAITAVSNALNKLPGIDIEAPNLTEWKSEAGEAVDILGRVRAAASSAYSETYVSHDASTALYETAKATKAVSEGYYELSDGWRAVANANRTKTVNLVKDMHALVTSSEESAEAGVDLNESFSGVADALNGAGNAGGKAADGAKKAGKAAKDLLAELNKELDAREELIGLTDEEHEAREALQTVYQKLGDDANRYSEEAIQATADRIRAIDQEEERWEAYSTAADSAWDTLLDGVFTKFEGTFDSLKNIFITWLKQMIMLGRQNPIQVFAAANFGGGATGGGLMQRVGGLLGGDPLAGALSKAGVAGVQSVGLLGSVLGSWGGGASAGLLGGLGGAVSGLMSGGIGGAVSSIGASLTGATSGLAGFAGAVGALAGPIGLAAAAFSLFKTKTEQLDAGIKVTIGNYDALAKEFSKDTGFGGVGKELEDALKMVSDELSIGAIAESYQRVKKTKFGGLRKTTRTHDDPMFGEDADPILRTVGELIGGVTDMAATLGIGADAFKDFTSELKISTKGLSDDEAAQAISEALGGFTDDLASMIPGIQKYALENEGAATTLQRLTGSLSTVNATFDALGAPLYDINLAGAGAAAALVELSGGLENFNAVTGNYYDLFYSADEKMAHMTDRTRAAFEELGYAMPATAEGFKALVDGLLAGTAEDQAAAFDLMALASPLRQIYDDLAEKEMQRADMLTTLANVEGDLSSATGNLSAITNGLENSFAAVGMTVPTTTASLIDAVKALDLTGEAASKLFAMLDAKIKKAQDAGAIADTGTSISGSTPAATSTLSRSSYSSGGSSGSSRGSAKKAASDEIKRLQEQLWRAQGREDLLRKRELKDLKSARARSLQKEIWAIEDSKALRQDAESIKRSFSEISEQQRLSAMAQLENAVKTGKVWDENLEKLLGIASEVNEDNFSSYTDYLIASAKSAAKLNALADLVEGGGPKEEKASDATEEEKKTPAFSSIFSGLFGGFFGSLIYGKNSTSQGVTNSSGLENSAPILSSGQSSKTAEGEETKAILKGILAKMEEVEVSSKKTSESTKDMKNRMFFWDRNGLQTKQA